MFNKVVVDKDSPIFEPEAKQNITERNLLLFSVDFYLCFGVPV